MSWLRRNDHQTEHRYTEERLSAYLDGELTPKERAAVDAHLVTCRECRLSLETLRQTIRWTRGLRPVPLPRAFTIPVPARAVRAARPAWGLSLMRAATVAVALLFVVAVAGNIALTGLPSGQAAQPVALKEAPADTAPAAESARTLGAPAPTGAVAQAAPAQPPAAEPGVAGGAAPAPAATAAPALDAQAMTDQASLFSTEAAGVGEETADAEATALMGKLAVEPTLTSTDTPAASAAMAQALAAPQVTMTIESVIVGTAVPTVTAALTEMATPTLTPTPTETPSPTDTPERIEGRPPTETPVETPAPTTTPVLPPPAVQPTEPAVVAAAPAGPPATSEPPAMSVRETLSQSVGPWLKPAAGILGALLVVLAAATLSLGVRRRRRLG